MEQKHMWNQKIILYYSTLLILLKYNLGLGFMVFNTTFAEGQVQTVMEMISKQLTVQDIYARVCFKCLCGVLNDLPLSKLYMNSELSALIMKL
jgi:hypothetical protein